MTLAFWKKYPNELSRHVLSVDTIHRSVDPETQCMSSTRIMTKTNRKPQWMQWWVAAGSVIIVEESVLDPTAKTLTTYTKNITLVPYVAPRAVLAPAGAICSRQHQPATFAV